MLVSRRGAPQSKRANQVPQAAQPDGAKAAEVETSDGTEAKALDDDFDADLASLASSLTTGTVQTTASKLPDPHEVARDQASRRNDKEYLHETVAPRVLPAAVNQRVGQAHYGPWTCRECRAHNHTFNGSCEVCGHIKHFDIGEDVVTPYGSGIISEYSSETRLYTVLLAWRMGQHESSRQLKQKRMQAVLRNSLYAQGASDSRSVSSMSTYASTSTANSQSNNMKVAKAFLHRSALRCEGV